MDQEATKLDALKARREAMRERLRAKCEKIVAAVEALPEPKTYLEAERAARAVMLADRMVERVFSEPKVAKPARQRAADFIERERSRSKDAPVDPSVNAPIVSFAATSPALQGKMRSVLTSTVEDDTDQETDTSLSKTDLKLEQIVAKITALDQEFRRRADQSDTS